MLTQFHLLNQQDDTAERIWHEGRLGSFAKLPSGQPQKYILKVPGAKTARAFAELVPDLIFKRPVGLCVDDDALVQIIMPDIALFDKFSE